MTGSGVDGQGRDFFISHATEDRAWAEWVAVELERAGYTTYVQPFDFRPGSDFAHLMQKAATTTAITLAILSPAYLKSEFAEAEWRTAFADDPSGELRRLIGIKVEPCDPQGLLKTRVYADLVEAHEDLARRKLLAAVDTDRPRPTAASFPGTAKPVPYPGADDPPPASAAVTRLPHRDRGFVGRETTLARIGVELHRSGRVVTRSRDQMAGVGKTQLAVEYAYRFVHEYDVTWLIPAERLDLISGHLTQLAAAADVARADATGPVAQQSIVEALRKGARWLLIFDNAEDPEELATFLPSTGGHVIVTSRNRGRGEFATPVEVGLFDRAEAIKLLQGRVPSLSASDADQLAEALGDLPLALAQAATMLDNGFPPADYLAHLRDDADELLDHGQPGNYPSPLTTTIRLAREGLSDRSPEAAQLLELCALLGPEPIPTSLFSEHAELLHAPLRDLAGNRLAFHKAIIALGRSGLVGTGPDGVLLHRLVQAILRKLMSADGRQVIQDQVAELVAAATPEDTDNPTLWPQWASIAPHIIALNPADSENFNLREAAGRMVLHVLRRGEYESGINIVRPLYEAWRERLGADDMHTLKAATEYAHALFTQGRYQQAHDITADTLERYRRVAGEDHLDTLRSAADFATTLQSLGDYTGAQKMRQHVLDRRQRILGPDHHDTLTATSHLASTLHSLGDYTGAQKMQQDILDRTQRILGPDHPDTLNATSQLASTLHSLGDYTGAQKMRQHVLDRRQRILGPDHPDTLTATSRLATTLHNLGDYTGAQKMQQDILDRTQRILGPDHPYTLNAANHLASTLNSLGRHTGAQTMQQDVLDRRQRILGPDHPDTLTATSHLASTLHSLGDYTSAQKMQQDVLHRRQRILGPDHPDTLTAVNQLASTLNSLRDYTSAQKMQQDVLHRTQRILGPDHPYTVNAANQLASTLNSLGDYTGAQTMQQDVLHRRQRTLGPDHPHTLNAAANLANILLSLRRSTEALAMIEDVYGRSARTLGKDHPQTLDYANAYAHALLAKSRIVPARALVKDTLQRLVRTLGPTHPATQRARDLRNRLFPGSGGKGGKRRR